MGKRQIREDAPSVRTEDSERCALVVYVWLDHHDALGVLGKSIEARMKRGQVGDLEHHDVVGITVPLDGVLRIFRGKEKGCMYRLCGLQPVGKIVTNDDVQLGRRDLRVWHVGDHDGAQKSCQAFSLTWGYVAVLRAH